MPGHGRRLLVVEDEALTAGLMAEVLRAHGFAVEIAPDVVAALDAVEVFDPDAALIDVALGPGPSGLDLAFALSTQRPDIALVILSRHSDLRALGGEPTGIPEHCAFLQKGLISDSEYLLGKLESVLRGRVSDARDAIAAESPLATLTTRQLETLRLMSLGYTNEHIAECAGVSVSTVERRVMEVFRALGLTGRQNLNPRVEAVRIFGAASGLPERP
jgi:DNA-binding NarL/FixJ family response regulator